MHAVTCSRVFSGTARRLVPTLHSWIGWGGRSGQGDFNEQLRKLVAIEPRLLRSNRSMAASVSTGRLQEANLLRHACFACIVGKRSVQERRREASDGPAFAIEGFLSSSNVDKAGVLANVL